VNYIAIIEKEDDVHGVVFPDFPGCVSAGDSIDEAMAGAREALSLHVQGMVDDDEKLPKPSTVDEIKDMKDWVFTDNPVFASIAVVPTFGKMVRANISIDSGHLAAIDDAARQRKMTRSAFLVSAAKHEIER